MPRIVEEIVTVVQVIHTSSWNRSRTLRTSHIPQEREGQTVNTPCATASRGNRKGDPLCADRRAECGPLVTDHGQVVAEHHRADCGPVSSPSPSWSTSSTCPSCASRESLAIQWCGAVVAAGTHLVSESPSSSPTHPAPRFGKQSSKKP